MKFYLASPWFSPSQDLRERSVKAKLRELGFEIFSPREASELKANASTDDQKKVFDIDISAICDADAVFAITNDKDMGTIFECGYAYANHIPIIYFAEGLTGQFNLMLAQSGHLVFTSLDSIDKDLITNSIENDIRVPYKGEIE